MGMFKWIHEGFRNHILFLGSIISMNYSRIKNISPNPLSSMFIEKTNPLMSELKSL